ncbi:MAG TPA: hypothetical protein VFV70_00655, partial [Hyphomonadaceae bacterium]|nr:hypothetical protein [Hyphomonadaceae bacterium]
GVMKRCVVYNPGRRFAHYNLHAGDWGDHPYQTGEMAIFSNRFIAGPSTDPKAAAFMLGGEGDLRLAMANNVLLGAKDGVLAEHGTFGSKKAKLIATPKPLDVDPVPDLADILGSCGARPWDRDPIDARIVADVRNGTGKIIDSEQDVGGYPTRPETRAPFVEADWNLDTMERKQR